MDDSDDWIEEIRSEPPKQVKTALPLDEMNQLENLISDNGLELKGYRVANKDIVVDLSDSSLDARNDLVQPEIEE